MFQIFLHERLKPALSLNINYSESVGGILVFHSAVYSVTNSGFILFIVNISGPQK